MAADFERDLRLDGIPLERIEVQVKRSKDRILAAPVAILLCLEMSEMDTYPDENRSQAERLMAIQSVAAAGLQILLAAHAEGLGSVWACWPLFAQETIRRTLDLPETWEPQAMFFVGYADEMPKMREKKMLRDIVKKF
jgi:coenzyme F420-0:L-glutamate ligase/coenzyme F420-1:gamma-L-glutamate ligase